MASYFEKEKYLNSLPERHQNLLFNYRNSLTRIRDAIEANNCVIRQIVSSVNQYLFVNDDSVYKDGNSIATRVRPFDIEKVQVILKQIMRDWSDDGQDERQQCYQPIIDEVTNYFQPVNPDLGKFKVLVPGAGLARLMYELACKGFYCEGNEFSFFMLITSNFILNR